MKLMLVYEAAVTCLIEAMTFDINPPIPSFPAWKCLLVFFVTLFITDCLSALEY